MEFRRLSSLRYTNEGIWEIRLCPGEPRESTHTSKGGVEQWNGCSVVSTNYKALLSLFPQREAKMGQDQGLVRSERVRMRLIPIDRSL